MSFRIFASGTVGFTRTRNWPDEGDVFEIASAAGRVSAAGGGVSGLVENEAASAVTPDSAVQQALTATGMIACAHQLNNQIALAYATLAPMIVSLTARRSNLIMPDSSGFTTVVLSRGVHNPYQTFIRAVYPVLERTDLNRFTVLCALAEVFSLWSLSGSGASGGQSLLNITVTAT